MRPETPPKLRVAEMRQSAHSVAGRPEAKGVEPGVGEAARVRGEKIARFSEYFNPTILMEAFDNNMDNMKIAEQEAAAFLSAQQNS